MAMFKYILKRLGLLLITFVISSVISFTLIRLLVPDKTEVKLGAKAEVEAARREALGYNKPIMNQLVIYVRNIVTKGDFGYSWQINYMWTVKEVLSSRMTPTIILNIYSIIISIPLGILLGIWAAIKKNKPTDHIISTSVMFFISVPSFVIAFILQYYLGFKLGWFPVTASSLYDAEGSWFSLKMTHSLIMPVLALSFGSIASFARSTRAELTEALTSDYMLLARSKGLTKTSAISRHALRNAMVPILPGILGMFLGILSGSMVIETIFGIGGISPIFLRALTTLDYDVFIGISMFYFAIGLGATIVIDLSYGFIDPRIRMGER